MHLLLPVTALLSLATAVPWFPPNEQPVCKTKAGATPLSC